MRRRSTIAELRWPETPEFVQAASQYGASVISDIAAALWAGYDSFFAEVIEPLGAYPTGDEMERSITLMIYPHVRNAMTGFEPYYLVHAHRENESRAPAPAQAPEYDLAFVLHANPRVCWPVEAKFLPTDGTVQAYIDEINEQYVTCRYGPFSSSGAMLAYLFTGDPVMLLSNIQAKLGTTMKQPPFARDRHHRTSDHVRKVPLGKPSPSRFECHHLIMPVRVRGP